MLLAPQMYSISRLGVGTINLFTLNLAGSMLTVDLRIPPDPNPAPTHGSTSTNFATPPLSQFPQLCRTPQRVTRKTTLQFQKFGNSSPPASQSQNTSINLPDKSSLMEKCDGSMDSSLRGLANLGIDKSENTDNNPNGSNTQNSYANALDSNAQMRQRVKLHHRAFEMVNGKPVVVFTEEENELLAQTSSSLFTLSSLGVLIDIPSWTNVFISGQSSIPTSLSDGN